MSKAKTTTSNEVDPFIPSNSTFNLFQDRASDSITPEFQQSLASATNAFNSAAATPDYAPGLLSTAYRAQDPSIRSGAFDQVKQNVANDVLAGVNSTFGASGMTGSSLHQQNLARGLTEGIANVENQAFQQGEDRALQGANLVNTAFGQNFARDLAVGQALQGVGTSASQTQTQSQSPGLFGALGAGLQVASLFSDKNLKEDEKRVGQMDDGTPIYTYKYREGFAPSAELEGVTMMGVMAQDVKGNAVEADTSGFLRVNYGAL